MAWNKNKNIREASEWLVEKFKLLDAKENMIKTQQKKLQQTGHKEPLRELFRGGVYWVNFGNGNVGAEKNKTRPGVIISPNHMNKAETVIVIPISSKFKYQIKKGRKIPKYKNHFILYKQTYRELDDNSVIKCEDIRSIDVARIGDLIFNIYQEDMRFIKTRILYTMGY
ncbi:type II toxin-antitoxin system PemK/MazF family toxin [Gracilibacillus timonensis]|uniref:type II toxin-antitoxin system PemK/MazF family toxin n=1 Tax=Gracilibacillus timonensis TaxID=1816696 RepID=UPI000824BD07|nr:type II toxin-antitoxin system PemK/MazF family toxin [Gracilibacillus timonensis]